MRPRLLLAAVALTVLTTPDAGAQQRARLNPVIDLLEQRKPVFGVLAPTPGRGGGRGGRGGRAGAPPPAETAPAPIVRTQAELARDAVAYRDADFYFSGSMEGGIDRALPAFTEFMNAMRDAGWVSRAPSHRLVHPIAVKTPSIDADTANAAVNIGRQLNMGVSILNFVVVDTPEELARGIAAMRFRSKGGTRPDDVGNAPAYWGLTDAEYRARADVWPLDPNGELVAMPIIESREGVARVREIAQVKGVGALIVGAGTLGGVYSTTDAEGRRVRDDAAWEGAIQQILAACKEFSVPCGYPVNERDVEARVRQGFTVFIIQQWGEPAFRTVELGRRAGGR